MGTTEGMKKIQAAILGGVAGIALVAGSIHGAGAQNPALAGRNVQAPVIAQQVVAFDSTPLGFWIEERAIEPGGSIVEENGPGFLIGAEGRALVERIGDESMALIDAGEATPLRAGDTYAIEPQGAASVLTVTLRPYADDAGMAGQPLDDLGGRRDLELRIAELDLQDQTQIASESGAGLLMVLRGSISTEDASGAATLLSAGQSMALDDSTPVSGAEDGSVVLAVTLGADLGEADALSDQSSSTGGAASTESGSANSGTAGSTAPTIEILTDSDGDGLWDSEEAYYGSDPANPDTDQDGLSDGDEVYLYGSSPTSMDTDGDGLPDVNEVMQWGTDPANPDTDGDGLNDHDELNHEGADPTKYDSDGDGLNDYEEAIYGGSSETADYDGDGLTDYEEAKVYGTSLSTPDTDGDGLWDYNEVTDFQTDPTNPDTDGDGLSDGLEVNDGSDPLDPNSPQN